MEPWTMTAGFRGIMNGEGLMQRAARSSAITLGGVFVSQFIRLASNLILTRLLFPEAFGTMAIVSVFLMGLAMFSDMGIGPAIMQSKRGDDQAFLNTAWTIQIMRGFVLWIVASLLAWPVSIIYGEPALLWYLPVAAFGLVFMGFFPTRQETAHRHMKAGRLTLIDLGQQVVSVTAAVTLAWLLQSVWALVFSGLIATLAHLLLLNAYLPGPGNRVAWERPALRELISFGKWIFLSTLCGFAISQSDKVLIGAYLSLNDFGLYNIAFFLASFPFMLGSVVMGRLLIPLYRECPPLESPRNRARLRRMRAVALGGLSALIIVLAFGGVWLVGLLYDDRYHMAGGIVVMIATIQMPALIILTSDQAVLAYGDSRRFFVLTLLRALLVIAGLWIGLHFFGLQGAIAGLGLANLAAYPVLVWALRPHGAWDPLIDMIFLALGAAVAVTAIWFNADAVAELALMHAG
jgi:O-antigen/teichoic acid export membrane protein